MEESKGQVPNAIDSQETSQQEQSLTQELVPVDTLKRASREAKEARHKLQNERARATELEAELHSIKQAQLEKQGKYKEMYDAAELKVKEVQEDYKALQKKMITDKAKFSFNIAAKDAGCIDPDSLWQLSDKNKLDFDENYDVKTDSLADMLNSAKQDRSYLFEKSIPPVADVTPGGVAPAPQKPIEKMTREELNQYMKENEEAIKKQFANQGF